MSGRPYAINFSIPGIGAANLTGSNADQNARVVLTCDPGKGSSSDPYKQINTSCFAPPQPGSDGTESARFFLHGPPINNVDLSISKVFALKNRVRMEIRADAFNALNHTQWNLVNNTVNFASLTNLLRRSPQTPAPRHATVVTPGPNGPSGAQRRRPPVDPASHPVDVPFEGPPQRGGAPRGGAPSPGQRYRGRAAIC